MVVENQNKNKGLRFKKEGNYYIPVDFLTKRYFEIALEPRVQKDFKIHEIEMKVLLQMNQFDIIITES